MFVVFDLDGTLALNEHRQHYVERPVGEKDWGAFFDACDRDDLNWPVARVLQCLEVTGNRIEIWSGRTDRVAAKTDAWLAKHGLGHIRCRFRREGDRTADHELKLAWLAESSQKPDLIFDDRTSVVQMWRDNGIACAQVAPGNF
jgi:hypothetical protein